MKQARVYPIDINVKDKWDYLYPALNSSGNTIDLSLSVKQNLLAAKRFFPQALKFSLTRING